jgi:hypothetical protein
VLREAGFLKAYRTQQYSGKTGHACDVTCPELPSIHWEVKRVEAGNPYNWIEQAKQDVFLSDSGITPVPIVAHKKNGKQWLAVLDLDDLITLLKETDRVK